MPPSMRAIVAEMLMMRAARVPYDDGEAARFDRLAEGADTLRWSDAYEREHVEPDELEARDLIEQIVDALNDTTPSGKRVAPAAFRKAVEEILS